MHRARTLAATLVGVCLIGLFAAPARAQRTYDFVTDNNNGSYTVLPNGTVNVALFFRETLANTTTTSQLVSLNGLFSSRVAVTRTTSPTDPARITAAAHNTDSFDINDSSTAAQISASGGASAVSGGSRFFAPGGTPIVTDSPTVRRIAVGSVTIQGGLIPLQTSTFTLSDVAGNQDTISNMEDPATPGFPLTYDPLIQNRTFTVTILPEPTAAGLVGLTGLLLMRRVRRR